MKLYYRGIAYEPSVTDTEKTGTQQIGHFLGQPFPIKAGSTTSRYHAAIALRYRGVDYLR
jgi:Domain of unknown function (DUF4278)